jgi:hypothetical protein
LPAQVGRGGEWVLNSNRGATNRQKGGKWKGRWGAMIGERSREDGGAEEKEERKMVQGTIKTVHKIRTNRV